MRWAVQVSRQIISCLVDSLKCFRYFPGTKRSHTPSLWDFCALQTMESEVTRTAENQCSIGTRGRGHSGNRIFPVRFSPIPQDDLCSPCWPAVQWQKERCSFGAFLREAKMSISVAEVHPSPGLAKQGSSQWGYRPTTYKSLCCLCNQCVGKGVFFPCYVFWRWQWGNIWAHPSWRKVQKV